MAGNRAVRALVARAPKVVKVGAEEVRIADDAEQAEAERIIKEVKAKFGVTFDSMKAKKAALDKYPSGYVKEEQRTALATRPWELDELKAIHRALSHFSAVLGDARKKSTVKTRQEFLYVGKLNTAPGDDPEKPSDRTRGEYFRPAQTLGVFEPGPDSMVDDDAVERIATHEIAHGIFDPHLESFMKMTGYWKAERVKTGDKDAEGPPDGYADTDAKEDLAQSVMYFFVDPKRLKEGRKHRPKKGAWGNPCPKRYDWIKSLVAGWTPKDKR